MQWISSNMLLIGAVFLVAALGCLRFPKDDPLRRWLSAIAAITLILLVIGVIHVVRSPPGGEEIVDQQKKIRPIPPLADQLEPLHLAWTSEDDADWPVAELLASMTETSYLTPVEAEQSYLKLGFKRFMPVVDGSMLGYFLSVDDMAVVVFRGTDNNIDWLINVNPASTQTLHGSMHNGFYRAYQPLKPQIVELLRQSKPKHLWITGHSLGGALALVCAHDLVENQKQNIDGLITFGQPMVVKSQFGYYLDKLLVGRYAHYVNEQDMVAKLPSRYAHCGSLVWFTGGEIKRSKRKQVAYGASKTETPLDAGVEITPMSDQEFERFKAEVRRKESQANPTPNDKTYAAAAVPWIDDHAMALYLERIRSVTARPFSKAEP